MRIPVRVPHPDPVPEPQTDPTPNGAPASPPTGGGPGAADPAREERNARLEADSQSYRSLTGRLRTLGVDKLNPEELAELVKLGQEAKVAKPQGDDPSDPTHFGRKTIPVEDHKAALQREREAAERRANEAAGTVAKERDHYKALYLGTVTKSKTLDKLAGEEFADYEQAYVFDALASDRVPYRLVVDEESGAEMVVDKKTGQEYRDPETRNFLTWREALAALPRFAPYVKRPTVPGGTGAGAGKIGGAPSPSQRSNGKLDPSKMTPHDKIMQAFITPGRT